MHKKVSLFRSTTARSSALVALVSAGWLGATFIGSAEPNTPVIVHGVVAGSSFTPPAGSTPSSTVPSTYEHAEVCADNNNNAVCDRGEANTLTDSTGAFELPARGAIIAEIGTDSLNAGHGVTGRLVLRASADQIVAAAAQGNNPHTDNGRPGNPSSPNGPTLKSNIAITPLSTEVVRMMASHNQSFQVARLKLAERLGVLTTEVLADPNAIVNDAAQSAVLTESVILTNRFALAAKMVDRLDVSPAALKANPLAKSPAITMPEAFEAAMNLEADSALRPHLHHHAREQGDVVDQGLAVRPEDQRVLERGNAVHQLLRDRQSERAEPRRRWRRRRLRHHRRQRLELRAGRRHRGSARKTPLPAGQGAVHQRDEPQHEEHAPISSRAMTAGGHDVADLQRVDESGPGLAAEQRGGRDDHRARPRLSGRQPGRRDRQRRASCCRCPASLYATKHNDERRFPGRAQRAGVRQQQPHDGRRPVGRRAPGRLRRPPAGTSISSAPISASGDVGNLNFLEPDQCDDMHGMTRAGHRRDQARPGCSRPATAAGNAMHLPRRQLHRLPDQEDPGVADLDQHRRSASRSS